MTDRGDPRPLHDASADAESASEAVVLVRTWNDGEALMIRQLLDSYGIPCQVASDVPHSIFPLSVDGLGEIRISVPRGRADDARALLAEHLRHGLELLDGGREAGESDRDREGA